MSAADQWADVKPGDKVMVTIEAIVTTIERFESAYGGDTVQRPFTAITYTVGEPHERPEKFGGGLRSDIFTVEVPDYDSPDVTVEVQR